MTKRSAEVNPPLYVDLDGTLIRSDSLWDSLALALNKPRANLLCAPFWALKGPAFFKDRIASLATPDPALLPYREELIAWIRDEKRAGRRVMLATAAHEAIAVRVAEYLGCFDGVLASTPRHNLKGSNKLAAIRADAGQGPFSYAGDSRPDLKIFPHATSVVLVGKAAKFESALPSGVKIEKRFSDSESDLKGLIRIMRPHQWAKNTLVFLPLIAAHEITNLQLILMTAGIFVAFSFCASSVYILNDFVDIEHDRAHHRKKRRPLAGGMVPAPKALIIAAMLLSAAALLCGAVSGPALSVLALYWVATCLYSFSLKRKILLDAFTLAGLYVARAAAGATLLKAGLSEWMTAFLIFLFLSLAFAKRFTELKALSDKGVTEAKGRGYKALDMNIVAAFGISSAFTASLVVALYVTGNTVSALYRQPGYLWIISLLSLYWLCRIWLKAWRGELHEDPVVFALKDHVTYLIILLFASVMLLARPI
jgi:4-hydroxybenzoate polyprenyltransferase